MGPAVSIEVMAATTEAALARWKPAWMKAVATTVRTISIHGAGLAASLGTAAAPRVVKASPISFEKIVVPAYRKPAAMPYVMPRRRHRARLAAASATRPIRTCGITPKDVRDT